MLVRTQPGRRAFDRARDRFDLRGLDDGMGDAAFAAVAVEYRRELWLWLTGDHIWAQCCAGLIGRVGRDLSQAP